MDYKKKKGLLKEYLESKKSTEREKDCIKLLWDRRPKPYGFKIYKEQITIYFN